VLQAFTHRRVYDGSKRHLGLCQRSTSLTSLFFVFAIVRGCRSS
jgi:hypothetical protein